MTLNKYFSKIETYVIYCIEFGIHSVDCWNPLLTSARMVVYGNLYGSAQGGV